MTLSKFNQQWFDDGRKARLAAQLHAYQTKTPVHLPLSSYNATAAEHWRNGWNSVSIDDIKKHCLPQPPSAAKINDPIANARRAIK
jgi:hypothetical protein